MRNPSIRIIIGLVVVTGAAALWVIPSFAQMPGTLAQPAMSPARVWINNQKREEAIPVNIVTIDSKAPPLPVSLSGPVDVRRLRQSWEYRSLVVGAGQDVAGSLAGLGSDGWEAAGMTTQPNGSVTVLLKRPR